MKYQQRTQITTKKMYNIGKKLKNVEFPAIAWPLRDFKNVIARLEEKQEVYGNIMRGINLHLGLEQRESKILKHS